MLILNTEEATNLPVLTDITGSVTKLDNFLMGDETGVYGSCSINWKNEMYILGGQDTLSRQISRLQRCRLTKLGSLDFHFELGGCSGRGCLFVKFES